MTLALQYRTVVSFLSPSSSASVLARKKLQALLGHWKPVAATSASEWDCVAMECPDSGTILQWLSLETKKERNVSDRNPFRLLAVQEASSLEDATKELQQSLEVTSSATRMTIKRMLRQPVTARDLLGKDTLPFLQWKKRVEDEPRQPFDEGALKEIVIPSSFEATYSDGRTLQQQLSNAPLSRPVTGLYQFSNGLCLRPLPTSSDDRQLSPPALVFHADLDNLPWIAEKEGKIFSKTGDFSIYKIGFNGIRKGQIMLRSNDWLGMDFRFCEQTKFRPGFAEAQEALLAGSLPSLQSQHVLDGAQGVDPKTDTMDCWVEFRESVKNPVGFWSKRTSPRIAKAPDLPYE